MSAELAHDLIELAVGPVTPILSLALRSMFIAGEGCKLIGGDFSQIEARINAWMAGEENVLRAYRSYDCGSGPDAYRVAYGSSFGISGDQVDGGRAKGPQRDIGKKIVLATGYQGSVGAWLRFDPNPEQVTRIISELMRGTDAWRFATEQYDRAPHHFSLSADQWISIKVVINGWRAGNPRIVQSWWDRQDGAIQAVSEPETVVPILGGKIKYLCAEGVLWAQLPSAKMLAYCSPRLVETKEDYLIDADGDVFPIDEFFPEEIELKLAEGATIKEGRRRTQVQFMGINQKTKQWGKQRLYGGMQANNEIQSTARELLAHAMGLVEDAGYPVALHVHDELISEVSQEFGSVEEYESLMRVLPPWLEGLPLMAKGWSSGRYLK